MILEHRTVEITHGHLFCGIGGGARGMNRARAVVGNVTARFRCVGGIDVDPGKVFCKCGEQIDAFDALLIYARAERRLQSTRDAIQEHERKEAERKAKKPFLRRVTGFQTQFRRGKAVGYHVRLEVRTRHVLGQASTAAFHHLQ